MAVLYTFTPPLVDGVPILDPGSTRSHKPKVLMPEYGDGYSQRAADGINNDPAARAFSWTNLTEVEKDQIDKFFIARNGVESFFYDHKNRGKPLVYICTDWEVTDVDYDVYTVTANFKQVYDL